MKSAYEIAMERLEAEAGPAKKLSDDEREQCAEIDRKFQAQIAEATLSFEGKIASASPAEAATLNAELTKEIARLTAACEEAKAGIWREK